MRNNKLIIFNFIKRNARARKPDDQGHQIRLNLFFDEFCLRLKSYKEINLILRTGTCQTDTSTHEKVFMLSFNEIRPTYDDGIICDIFFLSTALIKLVSHIQYNHVLIYL